MAVVVEVVPEDVAKAYTPRRLSVVVASFEFPTRTYPSATVTPPSIPMGTEVLKSFDPLDMETA